MDLKNKLVVEKPWGKFNQYTCNEETTVKIITVESTEQLSVQKHRYRDEFWVSLDDGLVATINGEEKSFNRGEELFIPRKTIHSIRNDSLIQSSRFLEISLGFFSEGDIERISDHYGRCDNGTSKKTE